MSIAYVNGTYLPLENVQISAMDRGFIFGDGVYEVIPVYNHKTFRQKQHLARFAKSLSAVLLDIKISAIEQIITGLLARSEPAAEHSIYIQVTRGVTAIRDHHIDSDLTPTIFAFCTPIEIKQIEHLSEGIAAITVEDMRWHRCDIKSINLLPNILLLKQAEDAGAYEGIFVKNGFAYEGTSSNLFMVKDGTIYTPPLSTSLLGGITRELILELASIHNLRAEEKDIKITELETADEVWLTSSTREVMPVISLNKKPVADGKVGLLARKILQYYRDYKIKLLRGEVD